ncbi:bifunctional diguanylate cyclase/phosphodiesterase [Sporosarcina sp. BI001-red]|uniref:bifunctional diguanylate cyclase/phosphodiesterase n=1 Tax=Sporosarcina sp. BI001-red TaxID=2282866 RepID=UPI000E24D775|nr:EAL domain-containing protein [Sporosarcina sp. BI001-red]REB06588.1 bifunctional diguanylate cyclase/phosphodiesterase [Sporosarcina sp. BI001-red]
MSTLKKPLALFILSLIFVGTVLFLVNEYKSERSESAKAVYKETGELLEDVADEANRFGNERVGELELIAKYIAIISDDKEELQSFLKEQNSKMPFLAGLGFISPDGEIMAADGSRFSVKERESFERAMSGHITTSELFSFKQDPNLQVTAISVPVNKDGKVIGVLSGVTSMSDIIHRLVSDTSLLGTVYLIKNEQVVYTSGDTISEVDSGQKSQWILNEIADSPSGVVVEDEKSASYLFYKMAWNDWVTAVDSSGHPDMEKMLAKRWHYTFIASLVLLTLIGSYLYILRLEKIQQRAFRQDVLTQIGNLLKLEEDVDYLQRVKQKSCTIILLNLRGFKNINNWAGYENGDRILVEVGERLSSGLAERHSTYRIGGGEFVVLLPGSRTREQAEDITSELCDLIQKPFESVDHETIRLNVYAGIRNVDVSLNGHAAQFIHDVVFACQEARQLIKVPYAFFTDELEQLDNERKLFVKELSDALNRQQFKLVYQPIFSFQDEKIVSFETLLRWDSSGFGMVNPIEFISLLEETGMILEVGDWIIEEAALQVRKWRYEGYPELYVTVNVSVKQLLDESFVSRVSDILLKTNASPDSLVFEITESVVVEDSEKALQTVTKLNELGISTALDDFGTGYSSLAILSLLPFQYLKVDRSFLDDLDSVDSEAASVLRGIVSIASGLGQVTIMEGVETKEQLDLLREIGADRIQGYYFSQPVPPDQAFELLRTT